jgi:hypothetical protein
LDLILIIFFAYLCALAALREISSFLVAALPRCALCAFAVKSAFVVG